MHLAAQWHALSGQGHAILDRSYFGDTAFARLQLEDGSMTEDEFDTYCGIYHSMTATVLLPNICVRLLVSPAVALERVKRRMEIETGRQCESGIPIEYQENLDKHLSHMCNVLRQMGVTVYEMPWDIDRMSASDRQLSVEALASRIETLEPPDFFLDLHRRTI
jgi:deoxyadenosine/deoxycytidine kinase